MNKLNMKQTKKKMRFAESVWIDLNLVCVCVQFCFACNRVLEKYNRRRNKRAGVSPDSKPSSSLRLSIINSIVRKSLWIKPCVHYVEFRSVIAWCSCYNCRSCRIISTEIIFYSLDYNLLVYIEHGKCTRIRWTAHRRHLSHCRKRWLAGRTGLHAGRPFSTRRCEQPEGFAARIQIDVAQQR